MEIALPPFALLSVACFCKWQTALTTVNATNIRERYEMTLVADDIVAGSASSPADDVTFLTTSLHFAMSRNYRTTVASYGKNAIDIDLVKSELQDCRTLHSAEHTARYLIASMKHASHIAKNYKQLFLPLANGVEKISIEHGGLRSHWDSNMIRDVIGISIPAFNRLVSEIMTPVDSNVAGYSDSYTVWAFNEPRLQPDYTGNPQVSTLSRALWLAKRNQLYSGLSSMTRGDMALKGGQYWYIMSGGYQRVSMMDISVAARVANTIALYQEYKPTAYDIKAYRRDLLEDQTRFVSSQAKIRQDMASQRFSAFWAGLKSSARIATPSEAAVEWNSIPLLAHGSETSRTWGIEIETVRANDTSRPPGWDSRHDGSLPDGDEADCSCDCDDCSCNEHCNDSDYSCYESGEFTPSGRYSREFVSPVLSHFNSEGLRKLCSDLGTDENEDGSAGIHVHVGARDLTVTDVTRLLVAYSAVERLIDPLLHRHQRSYCKETTTDTLRWWLRKSKEYAHSNPDDVPLAVQFIHNNDATPLGRYVDVNLHALSAHGTIEFRSMGAWYDYEHLVRWAWFAREMVNVSKLGIDQREWTSCRSITDVINVLRKYGSELPSNDLFAKLDTSGFLSFDEE